VSRKKKGKGAAKKSGKGAKKKKSLKRPEKKPTKKQTRKPTERPAKEPTKRDEGSHMKKPVDMVQARENISDLVRESAAAIANGVILVARSGQLASAKYLFEAVGLYPATVQTPERPVEDTLAHTLLKRLGLPLEPVVTEDDEIRIKLARDARGMRDERSGPNVEREEARPGCEEEQRLVEDKGESRLEDGHRLERMP
jgi:hypothetical protein